MSKESFIVKPKKLDRPSDYLADIASEQILLATVLKAGESVFYEADAYLKDTDMWLPANKIIYAAIKKLLGNANNPKIDIANILQMCKNIDPNAIALYSLTDYLIGLSNHSVNTSDVVNVSKHLAKLSLLRQFEAKLDQAKEKLVSIDTNQPLSNILSLIEEPFVSFTSQLIGGDDTINLSEYAEEYINYVALNQPDCQGISTGFNRFDALCGGGLREGVTLIAGRAKSGKSFMGVNVATNVAFNDIPVLYLDTELSKEMIVSRLIASISDTPIDIIESGGFVDTPENSKRVQAAVDKFKKSKVSYHNISGKMHLEWLSIIRKWIIKKVGFDADGRVNPCLVVLDYIKVMNLAQMGGYAEHQYLGQIITDLHNFCQKYHISILSFVQLNRDGITKEDQGIIAGSDRLIGLCVACWVIKKKTEEDYVDDPKMNGDRKLWSLAVRSGNGTDDGEYINLITDLAKGKIREGLSNLEQRQNKELGRGRPKPGIAEEVGNDFDDNEKIFF